MRAEPWKLSGGKFTEFLGGVPGVKPREGELRRGLGLTLVPLAGPKGQTIQQGQLRHR